MEMDMKMSSAKTEAILSRPQYVNKNYQFDTYQQKPYATKLRQLRNIQWK